MKKPYNSKARIVADIAIQALFYGFLLGVFWLLFNLIP